MDEKETSTGCPDYLSTVRFTWTGVAVPDTYVIVNIDTPVSPDPTRKVVLRTRKDEKQQVDVFD